MAKYQRTADGAFGQEMVTPDDQGQHTPNPAGSRHPRLRRILAGVATSPGVHIPWSGSHQPPEKPKTPADHRPRQRMRTHPETSKMRHATSTVGGVVGLEKPDIVITHTDATQTHAKREKKEKEKYWVTAIGI